MKRLMLAVALACVLSSTSIAGEIPSAGAPAPPPPTIAGEIPSGGVPTPAHSDSMLVTAILTIISIVAK